MEPLTTTEAALALLDAFWSSRGGGNATFGDDNGYSAVLPFDTWTAMGSPETVTVTVVPGDALNV